MPAVSVVIPVYNVDKYLSCCLNSVINQTMTDIEIILVNDGSTDNSEEICKEYAKKDSRVVYIKQENKGVSVARNTGKKYSKGEYIIFIDSDDEMNLSMIEKLYRDIKENNADIAVCGIQRVKEKSEIKEDIPHHSIVNRIRGKDALKSFLTESKLEIGAWNKLFKKTLIEDIDFYPGRRMNEDKFFVFECLMNSNTVTYRNEMLYYYYIREDSVTKQKFDEKWFDNIYFAEKIYDMVNVKFPELESAARQQLILTKYYLVCTIKSNKAKKYYKSEYLKLIKDIRKINIKDLKMKKSSRNGLILIKYFRILFEIVKGI